MAYQTFHIIKISPLVIGLLTNVGIFLHAYPTLARLELRDSFPNTRLSTDGWGDLPLTAGTLQTEIPLGATIERAYLYGSALVGETVKDVVFADTFLPVNLATIVSPNNAVASTVVWDVTDIIQDNFVSEQQDWSILEVEDNEGEALVVVYSNADTIGNTSLIFDGGTTIGSEEVLIPFSPWNGGDFLFSAAISLGFQPSTQVTRITVNTNSTTNRILSQSAGGQDDSVNPDGGLITVGGVGDAPTNPNPADGGFAPNAPRQDDEYYNLGLGNIEDATPFIQSGDTFVRLSLLTPSQDDNLFGLFVNQISLPGPPVTIHEPSTLIGLFSVLFLPLLPKRQKWR